jgi:hypothetical protein
MVMRGLVDGTWMEHYSLRGVILDIGTQMVFTISGVLEERRQLALWVDDAVSIASKRFWNFRAGV